MIIVSKPTLPRAWEEAVLQCWRTGSRITTQYDKPGDPPSLDSCALIEVSEPLREPRVHKCFPGGLVDLYKYTQEVVAGVHDKWIDPAAGKWSYTYHQRLINYQGLNQLDRVIALLAACPTTRRAQAITWIPTTDLFVSDPCCLQRLWFRVEDKHLVMHAHIRSNDAFKAAFMNMYAFTELQRNIATALSDKLGYCVPVGPYRHFVDSFHIYGSYFKDVDAFAKLCDAKPFSTRVWDSTLPFVQENFQSAQTELDNEE